MSGRVMIINDECKKCWQFVVLNGLKMEGGFIFIVFCTKNAEIACFGREMFNISNLLFLYRVFEAIWINRLNFKNFKFTQLISEKYLPQCMTKNWTSKICGKKLINKVF